jgi:hypothetical protein
MRRLTKVYLATFTDDHGYDHAEAAFSTKRKAEAYGHRMWKTFEKDRSYNPYDVMILEVDKECVS